MNPLSLALVASGWAAFALAFAGVAYTAMAAVIFRRFFKAPPPGDQPEAGNADVTILKPLHGDEVGLRRNLLSFLEQDHSGHMQVVFGLADPNDPALGVAEGVARERPLAEITFCLDGQSHGSNAKVSNLINMAKHALHDVIIQSDSDIGVGAGYLERVLTALAARPVGVVTCPYFGRAEAGVWSQLAAMGVSLQFLPNVIAGVSLGLAHPCMGSTIALRRETLQRIGGFQAFRDVLADDYAIGAAVRALGLRSAVAPVLVSHSCVERTLGEVFAHELRWARTVRGVDPMGHLGSIVTHPMSLALLAGLALGLAPWSLTVLAAAFITRVWLMRTVAVVIGRGLGPWWLLPFRDMLSFAVFVGSFFGRSVEWRGAKFHVTDGGDLKPV